MTKYTTIYLDLDGTIFDFLKSENRAVKTVLKAHNLPSDEQTALTYSRINQTWWERFEKGEIEKKEIFAGRFNELLETLNKQGNPELMAKDYFNALSTCHDLMDGAWDLLDDLKKAGFILCATTNGVSLTQYKRISESGIDKYFDYIFVSEDAKHQKPEKEYFDYVLNNSSEKDREKILIVGDSMSSDILGGINSGIDTCWYNPEKKKGQYFTKYEVATLKEIEKILEI